MSFKIRGRGSEGRGSLSNQRPRRDDRVAVCTGLESDWGAGPDPALLWL